MTRGIIYKYTSPSGKSYIGQTINEVQRRYDFRNLNETYAGLKIENARHKYGFILEVFTTKDGEINVPLLFDAIKSEVKNRGGFKNLECQIHRS